MSDTTTPTSEVLDERHIFSMTAEMRRSKGVTYTPLPIVEAMVRWARQHGTPRRVVDPGAGSGRFTVAAARAFPDVEIIAIENDPGSASVLQSNVVAHGLERTVRVIEGDYRSVTLPPIEGRTLFIGNPPYVRHHDIDRSWKAWYAEAAARQGLPTSKLAGLHLHFFVKTRELAKPGDYGCLITAAEWLEVNYGATLRRLLTNGMGCLALDVFPADQPAFPDVLTTAVITCFEIGADVKDVRIGSLVQGENEWSLAKGAAVEVGRLARSARWSEFTVDQDEQPVECGQQRHRVGDLFRVSRGQVTGANAVWVSLDWASYLPPRCSRPTVTRAAELIAARPRLSDAGALRRVIDLPTDLVRIPRKDWERVSRFIDWAREHGAHEGYIASHRAAWWSVGLYEPAPILVTYMGRRDPVFVRNICGARHLNIAHGLYPRSRMSPSTLDKVVAWLNQNVTRRGGRTYAGGLTKFEPREIERLPLPKPEELV
ncbi:MAG: methyltransferase [Alphaproteobacteria bacterium]